MRVDLYGHKHNDSGLALHNGTHIYSTYAMGTWWIYWQLRLKDDVHCLYESLYYIHGASS